MLYDLPDKIPCYPLRGYIKVSSMPKEMREKEDCDGIFFPEDRQIFIWDKLSITRQKIIFLHELLHVVEWILQENAKIKKNITHDFLEKGSAVLYHLLNSWTASQSPMWNAGCSHIIKAIRREVRWYLK